MAAGDLHQFDQAAGQEEPEGGTMTLIEHLEELRGRMIKSLIAVAVCSIVGFIFWDRILQFLLIPLPAAANRLPNAHVGQLVAHDIGEPFMVALKLGIAIGIMIASPILLYQTWGFIAPALTRRERKYAVPFTLLGVGLFFTGLAVGFLVLRYPIDWLVTFGSDRFILLTDADSYFSFVTYFLLAFAIVFELPLVLTFMSVVGIVNSTILRQKRLMILFGLWFLSCFITPGADPYSPIIIGAAFTVLFELSILLMRFIGR